MAIIIGCDSFLSLRNVIYGDLHKHLDDIHVLVDPNQYESSSDIVGNIFHIDSLIDFDYTFNKDLNSQIERTYFSRKAYFASYTFFSMIQSRSYHHYQNSKVKRIISQISYLFKWLQGWVLGVFGYPIQTRVKISNILQQDDHIKQYKNIFDKVKPKAVISFSPEGKREMLLVEAAKKYNIPTIVMIRSRDNIVAKIRHLPLSDYYFVWSNHIKNDLINIYPETDKNKIIITGSPQFDHHLNEKYRYSREEFFSIIGLDPNRPLIVYTMTTPGIMEEEIKIVQKIADSINEGKLYNQPQFLVRGHPRMFGSNVKLLLQEYSDAKVYPQKGKFEYQSKEHESIISKMIINDEKMHLSTLFYQDIQINVCGTMTIDSSIFDKPIINIYYDYEKNTPWGLSVKRFYDRSDVKHMINYGLSDLAINHNHCLELIEKYLKNPARKSAGRKKARENDCGDLDGGAGLRISKAINDISSA